MRSIAISKGGDSHPTPSLYTYITSDGYLQWYLPVVQVPDNEYLPHPPLPTYLLNEASPHLTPHAPNSLHIISLVYGTKLGLRVRGQAGLEKNKVQSIQVLYGLPRLVQSGENINNFPLGKLR